MYNWNAKYSLTSLSASDQKMESLTSQPVDT